MALLTLPIDPVQPDQEFSISLDGTIYILGFQLNHRSKRWFMRISQENGTLLVSGVPLVISYSLLNRFKKPGMPPGDFVVIDNKNQDREVSEDSFDEGTHTFYYLETGTVLE